VAATAWSTGKGTGGVRQGPEETGEEGGGGAHRGREVAVVTTSIPGGGWSGQESRGREAGSIALEEGCARGREQKRGVASGGSFYQHGGRQGKERETGGERGAWHGPSTVPAG
jgi:hypothetical protein